MTKYVNDNGVSEIWANTKNYISAQLLGKSDVGHTHSASEITDLPSGITVDSALSSSSENPVQNKVVKNALDGYIPRSGGAVISGNEYSRTANDSKLVFDGGTTSSNGASIELYGKDHSSFGGWVVIKPQDNNEYRQMILKPDGTLTWGSKNVAMAEDVVPRSGGAVMMGGLGKAVNNSSFALFGGTNTRDGAFIEICSTNYYSGMIRLVVGSFAKIMYLRADGTWTWDGTACQITSDQRLKQQISEIDDKLLDAWEDVNLVQFKYNDAVKEKSDNARLHTGYVVQQIDEACKSHGVDVSKYGLYCHEIYQEETREVEHEDGTKTIEVVRPASEHYSLRYTEALIVECAYLRKKLKELTARIEQLEKGNNVK